VYQYNLSYNNRVEHISGNAWKSTYLNGVQVVGGSNPLAPTNKNKGLPVL